MKLRIWIDLANSPHVRLFAAVAPYLTADGHTVGFTARDHAQTVALAEAFGLEATVVGGASPSNRGKKVAQIVRRADALTEWARRWRPDVALSHGSYAQLVAAFRTRVPRVTMMDYEHQPANHVSFRLADRVIVPQCFPERALRRYGARNGRVLRYPGFKEEVYLTADAPAVSRGDAIASLGASRDELLVLARPSPEGALYLRERNERFDSAVRDAIAQGARVVVLPRDAGQAARYAAQGAEVSARPVDAYAAIQAADAVVGGGGTMSREAALLGALTYTTFSGPLAAVDSELIRLGWLNDLRGAEKLVLRKRDPTAVRARRANGLALVTTVERAIAQLV